MSDFSLLWTEAAALWAGFLSTSVYESIARRKQITIVGLAMSYFSCNYFLLFSLHFYNLFCWADFGQTISQIHTPNIHNFFFVLNRTEIT